MKSYFEQYNTEDILSSVVEMEMMRRRDDEMIYRQAEIIISNLISYNITDAQKVYTVVEFLKLKEEAEKKLHSPTNDLFEQLFKIKDADDKTKEEFLMRSMMQIKFNYSRGDGYVKQVLCFANELYSKLDNEFKSNFGFEYSLCERLLIYIFKKYCEESRRLKSKSGILKGSIKGAWKYFVRRQPIINKSIEEGYVYRVYKKELYDRYDKESVDNIINFLGIKVGEVELGEIKPNDFNPLYEKPLIDFGEYIYMPLPQITLLNLPKLFHYKFIVGDSVDRDAKKKYKKHRGDVIEEYAIRFLGKIFDKEKVYSSLKYPLKKKTYEADVTVQEDDITIFCECKSKILTIAALQGNKIAIDKDVIAAIGDGYEQGVRSIKWLQEDGKFYWEEKNKEIKLQNTKKKVILCLTAENFGEIVFNIDKYLKIDEEIPIIPIAMNIYDLEIISRECTKEKFIKYLMFRQKYYGKITSMDELDVFMYSNTEQAQNIPGDIDKLMITDYIDTLDKKYYEESERWIINYND